MNENEFRAFLKKKGKKQKVIERNVNFMKKFSLFLQDEMNTALDQVKIDDIDIFIKKLEQNKQSAKGSLYVLMNYYKFSNDIELLKHTASMREDRTQKSRRIFPLRDFLNIDPVFVKKLEKIGIKNVDDMLKQGSKKQQRRALSDQLDIPEESLLELVKLSDLTRLGFVKAKLTRLYYNSGLDSPAKIAEFEPDKLHAFFVKFVKESNWNGMIPNPDDLVGNISSAQKLDNIVEG